jgi:Flp pilus assembly pilin Flp
MAEYVIVTLFCAIVLLAASSDGSAIDQLKSAFKSFFKAYSYAISVAPQSISP